MDSASLYKLVAPAREILMREWDPIGVAEIPEAADEYDSYIPDVFALLQKGATAKDLAAHLDAITLYTIGLSPNAQRSSAAASALLAMWEGALRSRT